jgi:ketosteroid isomerase-like protein
MRTATKGTAHRLMLILLALLIPFTAAAASERGDQRTLVRKFVAAFNKRDIEAMLSLAHIDIEWLSIDGTRISIETQGRNALGDSMRKYFASCPSCRSRLTEVRSSAQRVSAVEVASWRGKAGTRSQRSLSVYEFEQGRIRRVYYFPAEP